MSRVRLGAAGIAVALVASACAATPRAPDVAASPDELVGVAFVDVNRNGVVDAGERPAVQAEVALGQGGDVFLNATSTDDNGGFVAGVGGLGPAGATDLFVQVSFAVPAPDDGSIRAHYRAEVQSLDSPDETIVGLPDIVGCSASLTEALEDETLCGEPLLPDLTPLVADFGQVPTHPVGGASMQVDTTTKPGRVLLRFASATANLGDGVLHMIPDASPEGSTLGTWQRVWTDEQSFIDLQTGEFVYHEGHGHFHLDAFEQYRLLDRDGAVVAVGEKISFCLVDSLQAKPEAQRLGFGIFVTSACEEAGEQQALNPGWADYYGAGLDDQWIDITGVGAGDYLVEIVVDPDELLVESDESNNRATFPLTLDAEALMP